MKSIKKFINTILKKIKIILFFETNKKIDDLKFQNGLIHLSNKREKYESFDSLFDADFKIFSQNGEDGILDFLTHQLKLEKIKFIEVGVGDFSECNTRFIFKKDISEGLIIDTIKDFRKKVCMTEEIWKNTLNIVEANVDDTNINQIINKMNFFDNLDLFSIDIDGIDYWVIKSLPKNFSKIAVAEYNPYFGSKSFITVPNIKNFNRTKYHYSNLCFGCSLPALIEIMHEKNMIFVGTNRFRNNAFFINKNYIENLNISLPHTNNLKEFTNAFFLESRDRNFKKNYIQKDNILKEISTCDIFDLKQKKIIKIKDLI